MPFWKSGIGGCLYETHDFGEILLQLHTQLLLFPLLVGVGWMVFSVLLFDGKMCLFLGIKRNEALTGFLLALLGKWGWVFILHFGRTIG